jgi:hypothetical protein
MVSVSWKTAVGAAAWVLVVLAILGLGRETFRHFSKPWNEVNELHRAVAESTAALNDFIDVQTDPNSGITFQEAFELADAEIRRANDASIRAQVVAMDPAERSALRGYLADTATLARLREQVSRKVLAYSGSNSAVEEALAQARSASPYTADVYISSARKALGEMSKAAEEQAVTEKELREHVRAFRARLAKTRPTLSDYRLVADAELAKLDPPEKPAEKAEQNAEHK